MEGRRAGFPLAGELFLRLGEDGVELGGTVLDGGGARHGEHRGHTQAPGGEWARVGEVCMRVAVGGGRPPGLSPSARRFDSQSKRSAGAERRMRQGAEERVAGPR